MDPSKKPSITEIVSFLKKKQSAQEKDSCYIQELLMSCEKNFKNELDDMKKKFDEEKTRIEERYKKIIATKTEYYNEQTNVLYNRIDELKNEKSEIEVNLREEYKKKIESLNENIDDLTNQRNEAEHKIEVYREQFADFYRRIYYIEQNMNKDGDFRGVQLFNSVEKCSCGKSRNEDPLPINVVSERGDDPANPLASKAIVLSEKRSFVGDTSVNPERSSKIARVVPYSEQISGFMRLSDKPHDSDSGGKWLSEDDLCSAFEKDPELCWNAICVLYRQQISENESSYSMSLIDDMSIAELGKYLTNGDPDNKLRRTASEVSLNKHKRCKRLAIRYSHQLVDIYNSKKDRLFCSGAGIL